jgi:hypothetical protein
MIAQKVVDAKQPKHPICAFVTLPDSIAAAFRTFSHKNIPLKFSPKELICRRTEKDLCGL